MATETAYVYDIFWDKVRFYLRDCCDHRNRSVFTEAIISELPAV